MDLIRINWPWYIWCSVIGFDFVKTWHDNIGTCPLLACVLTVYNTFLYHSWDVYLHVYSAQMCALLCLSPNWLSISDLQESSDSSNTTVEDEDVKGKTAEIQTNSEAQKSQVLFAANESLEYFWELDNFWITTWHFCCIDVIVFCCSQSVNNLCNCRTPAWGASHDHKYHMRQRSNFLKQQKH